MLMDKHRGNFNNSQRCRACLISGHGMRRLEEEYDCNDKNVPNLLELLKACTSVQVSLNDNFPQFLCMMCLKKATELYRFKLQCEKADMQLHEELQVKNDCSDFSFCEATVHITPITTSTERRVFEAVKSNEANPVKKLNIPKQTDSVVPLKQRTCDQCGKEFKYRASMIKHRRKHNITSRSCTYCNESFSTATLLARHMEQTHAHLKALKCGECDKAFFKIANLRLHMNVHSGIKRHMCEVCGVSFALAGNLAAHRRLHTGLKPYTCNECGRGFTQQAALRSHEAGHSNKKDHICSVCGAAFSRAGALRNHCKRHLPVRPFVCNLCSKAFTFSSERKRHMTIHTGEKNHVCDICGSRFNRSTNLAVHRRIHTGETPHVCSVCGKRFSQAHCLRTHMATHPCALQEISTSNLT